MNLFDALCHCCKGNCSNSLHSWWLPFWNMQTTSRLYSAELQQQQQQLTPHHYASQTGSLLSEPLWGRKKKLYQTPNSVFAQATREANFDSLNWGEARPGSRCVPKKPEHFLFGPELTQNTERNYWMAEWMLRTIVAVIRWNSSVVSSYDSHVVGAQVLAEKSCLWEMHWDDKTWGNKLRRIVRWYTGENVDSTNFCPEGVNAERIWISPPSFFYGKDWSLLHRASHMEEI